MNLFSRLLAVPASPVGPESEPPAALADSQPSPFTKHPVLRTLSAPLPAIWRDSAASRLAGPSVFMFCASYLCASECVHVPPSIRSWTCVGLCMCVCVCAFALVCVICGR